MIEMHQDGEPLGRTNDDDDSFYLRRGPGPARLALAAPAMAIASLVVALVALLIMNSAQLNGESALISSHSRQLTQLTEIRAEAWTQWVAALVALALAVAAALRIRSARLDVVDDLSAFDDEDDGDDADPGSEALTDADLDVALDLEERRAAVDPPQWVQALVGAAVVVAVVATAFTTFTLVYALHAHASSRFF